MVYTQTQLWLLAALVLVIFEMSAPGLFYFFSFSCGALVAAGAASLGYPLVVQLSTLLASSFIALLVLRMWVTKANRTQKNHETNVFALIGKRGVVVKVGKDGQFAQVRVGGEVWSARAVDNKPLAIETVVKIKNVTGVKLVVEVENKINGKELL